MSLLYSTVSGNAVTGSAPASGGGGIFNDQSATVIDSTIGKNTSSIDGGGIEYAANDTDSLDNATVYQNTATGNGGNVDNLFTLTLTNSIVAGGSAAAGPDVDNPGTINSGDYNVVQTAPAGNAIGGTTTHDQQVDPQLLPLANNGGPTLTNADQATSPGTAFIPFSGTTCGSLAIVNDQRYYTRGAGGKCDVGAYEFAGVATAIHRAAPQMHRFAGHPGRGLAIPRLLLPSKRPRLLLPIPPI